MYMIKQTDIFSKWLTKLKDIQAKVSILRRVERVILLVGGDKSTQSKDIQKAKQLAEEL